MNFQGPAPGWNHRVSALMPLHSQFLRAVEAQQRVDETKDWVPRRNVQQQ